MPSGNGVTERCHRSVKVTVTGKDCSIREAVFRYNVMPRDDETAHSYPAYELYRYRVRLQGVDDVTHEQKVTDSSVFKCVRVTRCGSDR